MANESDPSLPPDSSTKPTAATYDPKHLANVAALLRRDEHPKQIGPYEILEPIGEGGMGTVYKAKQVAPIDRTVALKVIKFGMDTQAVLARFEIERRALSMMDHPNVARVLDAGTTETGRPYFVMEYVDGEPITSYADRHRLSVNDRLKLMEQACSALQHAHQKAILHRDLKPSNILVTTLDDGPVVKVIDFGVAKAIEKSSTEQTLFTEVGQLIGTPEYMSPEQADGGKDIDTRSDVYSLGVVLFELLSGGLPFESKTLRAAGYGEVCRIIREVDPPKPSAKLSSLGAKATTVAELRQLLPAALVQQLRSELDWIVTKSLKKERESRYASPMEMAQDIENYLANRPLRAGPESRIYLARKFVRRNKAGVIGAVAGVALLLLGIGATSWQAIRATRAEQAIRAEQQNTLAEKQRAEAALKQLESANAGTEKVNTFLIEMLQSADPEFAKGRQVLVRDLLDRAADTVGAKFHDQPKVETALRSAIGQTYHSLGALDKADVQLAAAYAIHQAQSGEDSRQTLETRQQILALRLSQDRLEEALAIATDVLARGTRLFGEADDLVVSAKCELATIHDHLGDPKEAERLYLEVIAAGERAGNANTEPQYITIGNLGQMLRPMGRLEEAEALCLKAYNGMLALKGADDPITINMQGIYGDVLRLRGRLDEAEVVMRDYFDRATRVFGPDHPHSIQPEQGLAIVLTLKGQKEEALKHFRNALARSRKVMGDDHRDTLFQITTLAASRANDDDHAEADTLFQEAYDGWVRTAGEDHPNAVIASYGLVQNRYALKRWDDALAPAKKLFEQLQDPAAVQIPMGRRARYLSAYGIVLAHLHRFDDAKGPLVFAFDALTKEDINLTGNREAYYSVVSLLSGIALHQGATEDAARWQQEMQRYGPPPAFENTLIFPTTRAATAPSSTTAPTTSAPATTQTRPAP